jgi:hypothetical protein
MGELLCEVIAFYLASRDFNGLSFYHESDTRLEAAMRLVEAGLVQVVSGQDIPTRISAPGPPKDLSRARLNRSGRCRMPSTASVCIRRLSPWLTMT